MRVQYLNEHMIHIAKLNPIENGVYILVDVSFYISITLCVSLLVDQRVPEGTCSQVLRSTSIDS